MPASWQPIECINVIQRYFIWAMVGGLCLRRCGSADWPLDSAQILVGLALWWRPCPLRGRHTPGRKGQCQPGVESRSGAADHCSQLALPPMVSYVVRLVTIDHYSEDLHELVSNGTVVSLGTWVILPSVLGILTKWSLDEGRLGVGKPDVKTL